MSWTKCTTTGKAKQTEHTQTKLNNKWNDYKLEAKYRTKQMEQKIGFVIIARVIDKAHHCLCTKLEQLSLVKYCFEHCIIHTCVCMQPHTYTHTNNGWTEQWPFYKVIYMDWIQPITNIVTSLLVVKKARIYSATWHQIYNILPSVYVRSLYNKTLEHTSKLTISCYRDIPPKGTPTI